MGNKATVGFEHMINQTTLSKENWTSVSKKKKSDADWKADAFQRREYYEIEQGRGVADSDI